MRVEVEFFRTFGPAAHKLHAVGEITPICDASVTVEVQCVTVDFHGLNLPMLIDEELRHAAVEELLRTYDEAHVGARQFFAARYPHISEVA